MGGDVGELLEFPIARLQLLRVRLQALFRPLALGDVAQDGEHEASAPVGRFSRTDGAEREFDVDLPTVLSYRG